MSANESLQLSPLRQELSLPQSILDANGWVSLRADTEAANPILEVILSELSLEDCGHSWRSFLSEKATGGSSAGVVDLLYRSIAMRPTALFVYVATDIDGSEEAVALATISDRVSRSFEHEGFPVLARCFIRPTFRGRGLYPHLVRHRVSLCRAHWGERLCAIHMGAANPAVFESLHRLVEWESGLVHVGDELLQVAGRSYQVLDLLAPTERYRFELMSALPQSSADAIQWSSKFARYLQYGAQHVSHGEIRKEWEQLGLDPPRPLQQWFDLLNEIGVLR